MLTKIKASEQISNRADTTDSVQKEDRFAKLIGEFGKWQLLVFSTVSLVKFSSAWVQLAILFLTPNLTFRCVDLPNATEEILNSTCYDHCQKYSYDPSPFENTIVSEWDLVCKRRWLASFTQTMLQLGILFGSVVFGFISDRYGRKKTFLTAIVFLIAFGLGIPFSPNYVVFTILRTALGFATAGTMVVSFVIVMEAVGPSYRVVVSCLFQIPFIIGHMTVPVFAYYFRSWERYTLALGAPPLLYLAYFLTLAESPRWLLSVGRIQDATNIVEKAAIMNNLPTSKIKETLSQLSQEMNSKSEPNHNYIDLFRPSLRMTTMCCCMMWLIFGVTFFGFNQYISQTSPDPFLSVFLTGAMQIPSNLLSIWLIGRFGRRLTLSISLIFSGAFVLLLYFVPQTPAVTITLSTLGVSCAGVIAAAIYIYTSELYPTVVRNMGIGACSTSMRLGSMVAPFISNTSASVPWLPTSVFGLAPVGAGLLCLLLPETKGRTLPDTLEDVK